MNVYRVRLSPSLAVVFLLLSVGILGMGAGHPGAQVQAQGAPSNGDSGILTSPASFFWPVDSQGGPIPPRGYETDIRLLKAAAARATPSGTPMVERDESAQSAASLTTTFAGIGPTGSFPPDSIFAAGPSHLVQMVNRSFRITDKSGGTLFEQTFSNWWANVTNTSGALAPFEPKVLYDQFSGRWIMLTVNRDTVQGIAYQLLSVSLTSSAMGSWCNWALRSEGSGAWSDYPQLGLDATNFYITSNQFAFADDSFVHAKVRTMAKSQFYDNSGAQTCKPIAWYDYWGLSGAPFTLQPAHTFGTPGTEFLVNSGSGSGSTLQIRTITGTWPNGSSTPPVLSLPTSVNVAAYSAPVDAPSSGSTTPIDTGDARLLNAVYRNGFLYTTHTVGEPCFGATTSSCIAYYKINVTGAPTLAVSSSFGATGLFYFYPAIMADPFENIFLVFARTGPNQFAESRHTLRLAADTGTQGSAQLHAGEAPYTMLDSVGRNRWGNYSGISLDPTDSAVWVFHQHASTPDNTWRTTVGRLQNLTLPAAFGKAEPTNGATAQPTARPLSWGSSTGATSYEYCLDTTNDAACTTSWISTPDTAVIVNMVGNTTYFWQVRARNAAGTTDANGGTWWSFSTNAGVGPADIRINPTSLTFPALPTAPIHVELDWMETGAHSHKPSQAVIDAIVQTFAREGFTIVIDVSNAIPHQDVLAITSNPSGSAAVQAIKAAHFDHANDSRYFYSIWGHNYSLGGTLTTSSGIADLPGSTHLVTLGSFSGSVGTFSNQVGTFIHEFGHNLGQRHGGVDHANYKPNYISVMNYFYQLNGIGPTLVALQFANTSTGFNTFGYSHGLLLSLNELGLNENFGIGLGRARDWNCDGILSASVARDIQASDPCAGTGGLSTIGDFDNWTNVNGFVGSGAIAPVPTGESSQFCITPDEDLPIRTAIAALRAQGLLPPESTLMPAPGRDPQFVATAQSFDVFNDGAAALSVTGMNLSAPAAWIRWEPQTFTVAPGSSQRVHVYVDFGTMPAGQTSRRLLVSSNDPDENPYPGGVDINMTSPAPPQFSKVGPSNGATGQPTSLALTWGVSTGTTVYEYCFDTTNNSTCDSNWLPTGTSTTASIGPLPAGTTYYWQARARTTGATTYADSATWWSFTTTTAAVPPSGSVRVVYVRPSDRRLRVNYYNAVRSAMIDLQTWFAGQLSGKTFNLYRSLPEICSLPQPAAYYASDTWTRVLTDVQGCLPVAGGTSQFAWVLYVDVVHACNAPGRLGAGLPGLTMLPRQDMDGLIGAPYFDDCGVQYNFPPTRYIGGAGHEFGHALGLPHPPGCDLGQPTCDTNALMWAGYLNYPGTYLRQDEKTALFASPFIGDFPTPPNLNAVTNGTFAAGTTGWSQFSTPDMSYIVSDVTGGALQFYRVPPPAGTSNQASVFQQTGMAFPADTPIVAEVDFGNSSSVRKRIAVLIHDSDFGDLGFCSFWLQPNAPLRKYLIRAHTRRPWTNATVSFYAATAGSDGGHYLVDNVHVTADPTAWLDGTDCYDPTAPSTPGNPESADWLTNGGFDAGLAPWGLFGQIVQQIAGGVFEFYRPAGNPPGVVLQSSGQAVAAGDMLVAEFELGNSSSVTKRVTVLLHDGDFSDLAACTFWLEPGLELAAYGISTFASKAWSNATISVYPATVGSQQWIRLDNVGLRRSTAQPIGTECFDLRFGTGPSAVRRSPDPAGAVRPDAGEPAAAWRQTGNETTLRAVVAGMPVEVGDWTSTRLSFESWLRARGSRAEVQVSMDGVHWVNVATVPESDEWLPFEVDLSAWAGHTILVRLVFDGVARDDGVPPDAWAVRFVRLRQSR